MALLTPLTLAKYHSKAEALTAQETTRQDLNNSVSITKLGKTMLLGIHRSHYNDD
jgi:hypothetical protein